MKVVTVPEDSVELPKLAQSREIGDKMGQRRKSTEYLGIPAVCISQWFISLMRGAGSKSTLSVLLCSAGILRVRCP